MALRKIITEENPILRKISKEVKVFDEYLWELLDDMKETMYAAEGVGLAEVQVGILKRVVTIDVGDKLYELINPEIIETSGEQTGLEGCLSSPDEYGDVTRPMHVKVKAFDRYGKEYTAEGSEFLARAFCHEIDHLNGVLFKDLATEMFEVEKGPRKNKKRG